MLRKLIIVLIIGELIFSPPGVAFANPAGLVAGFLYELALHYYQVGRVKEALNEAGRLLLIEPNNKKAIRLIEQIKREMELERGKERFPPWIWGEEKEAVVEEEKSIITAMERKPPRPKEEIAPRWIMRPKPGEIVTSKELEGYGLFSEAKILIDNQIVAISPVLIKEGDIWLSLAEIVRNFAMAMFAVGKDSFNIIRGDGLPLELNIGKEEVLLSKETYLVLKHPILKYKNKAMVNLEDLADLLAVDTDWDSESKTITIARKPISGEFTTFTMPKPKEIRSEELEKLKAKEKPEVLGRLLPVPPEVQPDIKINFHNYITYLYNNLTSEGIKSEQLRIAGDIYDYKLHSEFKWKDKGKKSMVEDGKFIGIYGKDIWFKLLNLNLNMFPMRGQSESYEGAEITKFHEPFTTKIFGGQRDVTVVGPASVGQVRYYGNILGIEQGYASDIIDFKAMLVGMDAEAETQEKAGTTSFPRRNLVGIGGATLHMPYDVDLSAQYAFCNYYPDNMKNNLIRDNNWRIGAKMDKGNILLKYGYEFVGDNYASISDPTFYQDYKTWDIYSRYRLNRFLSFSGAYKESQDNVDGENTRPTTKSKSLSVGSYLSLPTNTNISLNWARGSNKTTTPGLALTGSTSYDYMFNLFQNWKDLTWQFSYSRYELNNIGVSADSSSDVYATSLYKFLPRLRGSYLRARGEMRKTRYKVPLGYGYTATDYNIDFGFRYYFARNFSTYGNWRLHSPRREGIEDSDLMSFNLGSEWNINNDTSIGIDFNFAPYDLRNTDNRNSRAWSVLFRFSCGFDMSSPAKWGKIMGKVFIDTNQNGIPDEGEQGLSDILVRIPKENVTRTDPNGFYLFEEVIPGEKTIKLDAIELPIELALKEGFERTVIVESRQVKEANFALIESATIKGRIFVDENNNGVYDLGEDGIEGVSISLMPKYKTVTTDENGKFVFEYLFPGIYKIRLDPADIPIEYRLVSSEQLDLRLSPGEKVTDANFVVIAKPIVIESF